MTTYTLIHHLYDTYGQITPTALVSNDITLRQPFDPSQTIKALFQRMGACRDIADAGQTAYTDTQLAVIGYTLFFQTGRYQVACRE